MLVAIVMKTSDDIYYGLIIKSKNCMECLGVMLSLQHCCSDNV